jgi:Ca-activated chloride channel family protein
MTVSRKLALFLTFCLFVCLIDGSLARVQPSSQAVIIAKVELVQVPVIVFDDKGAVATNLNKGDFRILDDGIDQQILFLDRVRVPVSFVILADTSSSMTNKIPFVQEAALSLLNPTSEQDEYHDEFSVLRIGNRADRLVAFTRDQQDLTRRLPLLLTATNEGTALFDGIYLGVATVQREAANQRRAIIIISDGGDNHSRYNIRETRKLLEEADVPVFAVMAGPSFELPAIFPRTEKKQPGVGSWPQFPSVTMGGSVADYIGPAERHGPHNLSVLTQVTGGGVFTAANEEDLPRIVRTIGLAVRYQYLLAYKPRRAEVPASKGTRSGQEDGQHKIQVELYPQGNFKGYSMPYYKHGYRSSE